MFETDVYDGVLRVEREDTRWLSTSWHGGYTEADAAYNITVPDGFDRTDLHAYARERRTRAGFDPDGPTLLTGVDMRHARGARVGPVECVATAGLSNPAELPMDPVPETSPTEDDTAARPGTGTVNVILGTTRALDDGTLASLLASVVEAKTATLLDRTGFTGTTTDAVVVGSDPEGDPTPFAGSGTEVGSAARACVREALTASLDARYDTDTVPSSVEDAEYGTRTDTRATVYDPGQ